MSPIRRRQFYLVIGLMLLGAIAELVAIGSVVPFLTLLGNPSLVDSMLLVRSAFDALGADTPSDRITAAAAAFCLAAVVAALIRLQLA